MTNKYMLGYYSSPLQLFFFREKRRERERERKIFNKKFDYRFFRDEYTGEYKLPRGGTGEFYIRRI